VIPETTATGVGLSTPVKKAVPLAVGLVLGELKRLGVDILLKQVPVQPDIWWEKSRSAP
jgi:hypothetical protein